MLIVVGGLVVINEEIVFIGNLFYDYGLGIDSDVDGDVFIVNMFKGSDGFVFIIGVENIFFFGVKFIVDV